MSFFAGFLNTRSHRRPHIRRGPLSVRPSERPEGLQHKTSNTLQLEMSPNVPQVQAGQRKIVVKAGTCLGELMQVISSAMNPGRSTGPSPRGNQARASEKRHPGTLRRSSPASMEARARACNEGRLIQASHLTQKEMHKLPGERARAACWSQARVSEGSLAQESASARLNECEILKCTCLAVNILRLSLEEGFSPLRLRRLSH